MFYRTQGADGAPGNRGLVCGKRRRDRATETGEPAYRPIREQPREYPTRLEAGTLNSHGIAGLLAALKYIEETGIDTIHQKESALMERFYAGVRNIPGVTVYGGFFKAYGTRP